MTVPGPPGGKSYVPKGWPGFLWAWNQMGHNMRYMDPARAQAFEGWANRFHGLLK